MLPLCRRSYLLTALSVSLLAFGMAPDLIAADSPLKPHDRVVFLGDSITQAGNAPGGPAKGVPDDWDPFEQTPRNDAFEALRAAPASPGPGLSDLAVGRSSQEDSLDDLFGLGAGASPTDPFADPILAPPVAMPNTGAGTDPFRSLQKGPQAAIRTESDHVSDMQSPWVDSTPAPRRAPATGNPGSAGPVFSWDDRSRAVKSFGATTSFRAVPSADDRPAAADSVGADARDTSDGPRG